MEYLAIYLFLAVCLMLMLGFPVAFTLAGTALAFAAGGVLAGVFDAGFLSALPGRIFGTVNNTTISGNTGVEAGGVGVGASEFDSNSVSFSNSTISEMLAPDRMRATRSRFFVALLTASTCCFPRPFTMVSFL